jgi:peroxiredoxin
MPGLRKIFASYGDQMTIIAVNAGVADDIGKVKEFVQDFDLHMPVAVDDGRLGAWIGMRATPVHLVIGRDGRVVFAGHQDGPMLDTAIKQALASKTSTAGAATTRLADLVTLRTGDVVPPIELQSSDGKNITLPHGSSSRLRAIYFSATWCESYMKITQSSEAEKCKTGREQIDKLASDQRIEWFGVMSHMWTTPKALAKYESKMKLGLPLALDSSGAAFRIFGVKRFPAVALIETKDASPNWSKEILAISPPRFCPNKRVLRHSPGQNFAPTIYPQISTGRCEPGALAAVWWPRRRRPHPTVSGSGPSPCAGRCLRKM